MLLLKETSWSRSSRCRTSCSSPTRANVATKEPFLFFGAAMLIYLFFSLDSAWGLGRLEARANRGFCRLWGRDAMTWCEYRVHRRQRRLPELWLPDVFGPLDHVRTGRNLVRSVSACDRLAIARLYGPRWAQRLINGYTTFFRGTPLLCQLFLVYYGLGQFRPLLAGCRSVVVLPRAVYCAVFTFTQSTRRRIRPRSCARDPVDPAWPVRGRAGAGPASLGEPAPRHHAPGDDPGLAPARQRADRDDQASAFASLVTLFDLMGATRLAFARSFDLSIYLYAALIYLVLVEIIRRVWDRLELRLTRHMALR